MGCSEKNLGLTAATRILANCGKTSSQTDILLYELLKAPTRDLAVEAYSAGLKNRSTELKHVALDYLKDNGFSEDILAINKTSSQKQGRSIRLPYKPIPMRMCYILDNSLPYASGGYATRGHGIALGLKNNGFDVICVTRPGFPENQPKYEYYEIEELSNLIDGVRYEHILAVSQKIYSGWDYTRLATESFVKKFKQLKPEVVVAASNNRTALPALLAARRLGISFHYEVRGFWEITRQSREPDFVNTKNYTNKVRCEKMVSHGSDHVFTLNTPMKEELISRGVRSNDITLIPNSCDPSRFTPRPRDRELATYYNIPDGVPVIGYIGTFVQYEGLDDLVNACTILHAKGLDFRLLLVGNESAISNEKGQLIAKIEYLINQGGLSEKVLMLGRVPHNMVEKYYSLIDIAPFPRKPQLVTEMVSPMKPLEALAMEKAVVVSSVRALTEMVTDNETGLIFKKGDISNMVDILKRLIQDPMLRIRLGKTGRKWVEAERSWDHTTRIFAEELKLHIEKRRLTPSGLTQYPSTKTIDV
jgi:glycosyltransferase involved in cell wall biosynthesis